jgi:hypothetical protein
LSKTINQKGDTEMPEAIAKQPGQRPKANKTIGTDAVKKAQATKLAFTPKFEEMRDQVNPTIQAKALELKKIQKARTELSNEETKLNKELVDLMRGANLTVYEDDLVKIEPPKVADKFKVVVKTDGSEED